MKSINKTISLPLGDLTIYVDKAQQLKAEKFIGSMPHILTTAYEKGTLKFGNQLLRIIRRCLNNGMPPPGSGVSWPPHSAATVKALGEHTLLKWTGQYSKSVGIFKQKHRTYIGLPPNVPKIRKKGTSRRTLNQVAIMLEYGIGANLPPRPLWNPAYKSIGGDKALRKYIISEIRKQLRRY